MTDDKGACEGPYKIREGYNYGVVGPGIPNECEKYDLTDDLSLFFSLGPIEYFTEKAKKLREEKSLAEEGSGDRMNETEILVNSSGRCTRIRLCEGYFEQNNSDDAERIILGQIKRAIIQNKIAAKEEKKGLDNASQDTTKTT